MQAALTPYQAKVDEFRAQYKGMKIQGIEDSEGYRAVKEAAKEVRAERIAAKKEAKRINGMILNIKRQFKDHADGVVGEFQALEDGLRSELKRIDEERQELREKEEREKLRRFNERTEALFDAGFTYNGYQYTAGMVFVAAADVSDLPDSKFKAKIQEGKAEAERIEKEKAEAEQRRKEAERNERLARENERRAKEAERRAREAEAEAKRARQEITRAGEEAERRLQEAKKDEQRRRNVENATPHNVQTELIPETFQPEREPVTETIPPGFQAGFEACRNKVLAILAQPGKLTRKGLAQAVAEIQP